MRRSRLRSLKQRWPTQRVMELYDLLAPSAAELWTHTSGNLNEALGRICDKFDESCLENRQECRRGGRSSSDHWASPETLAEIEALTSVLGMLVHITPGGNGGQCVGNARRPSNRAPTYPTPPAAGAIIADFVIDRLIGHSLYTRCRNAQQADRHARQILNFRIVDPSVESGHLLIQIVISMMRCIEPLYRKLPSEGKRLRRAILERLYDHCLWGADKNPRAVEATKHVLLRLATAIGVPGCPTPNIIHADSLMQFRDGRLGEFRAVINNPPWGETIDGNSRHMLRSFSTTRHRSEAYVAFTENSVSMLTPGGILGFVLPSQVLGARNAQGLREYLLEHCELNEIMLLPRTAFADATVRGLVLLGRKLTSQRRARVLRVTRFPLIYDMTAQAEPMCSSMPAAGLRQLRGRPWTSTILNGHKSLTITAPVVRLGDLARLLSGVRPYGRGKGTPKQTKAMVAARPYTDERHRRGFVPACTGADILPFEVRSASTFVKLGSWLAWAGPHESLMGADRVFVRELCRRDGTLFAAVAPHGVIPLHTVVTVIPSGVDALRLAAILNSSVIARCVRESTASFTKVDFQRITLRELAELPVPRTLVNGEFRRRFGWDSPKSTETKASRCIHTYARRLAEGRAGSKRESEALLMHKLDREVCRLYGLVEKST